MQEPKTNRRDLDPVMHPSPEAWMDYLYGELPSSSKTALRNHLKACAECRSNVAAWEGTKNSLSTWKLGTPAHASGWGWAMPAAKWAIAALLVLGFGFGIGRFTAPAPNIQALRAALEEPIRATLAAEIEGRLRQDLAADVRAAFRGEPEATHTEFGRQLSLGLNALAVRTAEAAAAETRGLLVDFAENYRAEREEDQAAILTLFDRAEARQQANYLSLRRALETVAVVADDRFERTDSELGQLVSYAQAGSLWDNQGRSSTP